MKDKLIKKLTRLVIEAIHGMEYEEAIKLELKIGLPITIGRILLALKNKGIRLHIISNDFTSPLIELYKIYKENKTGTATIEDQDEETLIKLISIFEKYHEFT